MALFNTLCFFLLIVGVPLWLHLRKKRRELPATDGITKDCHRAIHSGCTEMKCSCGCHVESIPPRIRR